MIASKKGNVEIVKELIKNGADIYAKNNDKRRRNKKVHH